MRLGLQPGLRSPGRGVHAVLREPHHDLLVPAQRLDAEQVGNEDGFRVIETVRKSDDHLVVVRHELLLPLKELLTSAPRLQGPTLRVTVRPPLVKYSFEYLTRTNQVTTIQRAIEIAVGVRGET